MRGKGITDRVLDELIGAALRALDRPLTGPELIAGVSRLLGARVRTVRWGGWGSGARIPAVVVGKLALPVRYLLHLVAARGVVCSGPNRGVEPTFVRADAWVRRWRDVSRGEAERVLLRRYLRAFGPATPTDFALWTGIALSDARKIWAREETNIVPVSVEGWAAAVLREDLRGLKAPAPAGSPVRLLPYFDSFLLGHRTRDHLIARRHYTTVYRAQGWIAPVVLVDGRIAGVWAHAREGGRLVVRVTKFDAVSRRTAAGIHGEAESLARFLGGREVEVRIS
jgi:hypothetical protein